LFDVRRVSTLPIAAGACGVVASCVFCVPLHAARIRQKTPKPTVDRTVVRMSVQDAIDDPGATVKLLGTVRPARSRHCVCERRKGGSRSAMAKLDVEAVDLDLLVDVVREVTEAPLTGAIVGRSRLRDIVADHLECSMLEAEELVDTMVARGFA